MTRRELTILSRKKRMLVVQTVMEVAKVISDDVYSSWNSVKEFFVCLFVSKLLKPLTHGPWSGFIF